VAETSRALKVGGDELFFRMVNLVKRNQSMSSVISKAKALNQRQKMKFGTREMMAMKVFFAYIALL
jgi:hypothetical protein